MSKAIVHFDPFDEGFATACKIEWQSDGRVIRLTSDKDAVTCRRCKFHIAAKEKTRNA